MPPEEVRLICPRDGSQQNLASLVPWFCPFHTVRPGGWERLQHKILFERSVFVWDLENVEVFFVFHQESNIRTLHDFTGKR